MNIYSSENFVCGLVLFSLSPYRMPLHSDSSVLCPAHSAGTTSTDSARNANDDMSNAKMSDSKKSAR